MNAGKTSREILRIDLVRALKAAAVPLLVAGALVITASPAFALDTPLSSAAFTTDSEPANWVIPTVGAGNTACLTAGPSTSQTSIPDCSPTIDPANSGTLRFTPNAQDEVGSVFYSVSLPTSEGLDISFDSYQYDGTGADGISFGLAAANPADPTAPSSVGYLGGALGYSTNQSAAGVPYGYLGLGLDVYGNYENSAYSGSSCPVPSGLIAGKAYPESVTARGPGDGTTGYCILATTASAYGRTGDGSSNETVNNLGPTQGSGGYYLDNQSATSRSGLAVPVEIVINPSSSTAEAVTSGLTVPADSWSIAYKPLGASSWQSLSGALPTVSNNTVLAGFPSSWIDPSTGIPYQLTFGWTSSTGGSTEIHEVSGLQTQSLNGPVPVLALGNTDNESSEFLAGNQAVYTLSPSVSSDGGDGGTEASALTLTDTFPTGLTPGTASATSDWTCATSGQVVTCTYAPSSPIAAGTSLPSVTIPATIASSASGSLSAVAGMSSVDGDPATATDTATVTTLTASASPGSTSYGNGVLLSVAGMPAGATGTVNFRSGGSTLCSTTLPVLSCDTSSALVPGTYNVTANYSGNGEYGASSASTSFTITKSSAYTMTASATPGSVVYGASVVLSANGLPNNATGTVRFEAGSSILCTANLPGPSCATSSSLGGGNYSVIATYSGDANYLGSSASTAFTITPSSAYSMEALAVPGSTPHGNAVALTAFGLPSNSTGTVSFTAQATTLCTAPAPTPACLTSSTLAAGTYNVTASYSGDSDYQGSTASTTFAITKSSADTMTASALPTPTSYGNAVLLSVVGLPGDATGMVSFSSGGTALCTAELPSSSCDTSSTLAVGSYPVTATYSGDGNYDPSASTTSFVITQSSNYTMLAAAAPGVNAYGNAVSLSASGFPSQATGTVNFKVGTTTLCSASLPAPSCNTSSTLAPGGYSVTAIYSGDANYEGASASTSFTITKSSAYLMLASATPSSTPYGNAVSLSASGLPNAATGTVSFAAGGVTLCSASLQASSCATSSALGVGTYDVTATYSGDSDYNGSSALTSFTITKSSDYLMSASSLPSTTPHGDSVTLEAVGLPGDASGTVSFTSGATTLCSASVLAGATSCPTATSLGTGSYSVTASYSGDASYSGSSASTSFTITQSSSYSMTASASPASTSFGGTVTLSASGLPADATGSVSFASGTATLCAANLPALSCVTSPSLGAGNYAVTATYSGDVNYEGSSAATSFTITRLSGYSMTAAASPASSAYGNAVSLSVSGPPAGATGTVSFTSGVTSLCVASLPMLSCDTSSGLGVGSYSVTATYSGDNVYDGASASTSFVVTKFSSYAMSASATPGTAPYGSTVSLSVSGLPANATGSVTFASAGASLCTASVSGGTAACSTAPSLVATHYTVAATYSGDTNYLGSVAETSFTITKSSRYSMTASASPASTPYGNVVLLSVANLPGGATGTVSFTSGGITLCATSLPALSCDTAPTPGVGSHTVTATYSGDANYGASSAVTSFTITKLPSYTMTASATPGSASYGTAVLLSVSGLPGDATGEATFKSSSAVLCTASVSGARATCSTATSLPPGTYSVSATYSGDSSYLGASASTSFTITKSAAFSMSASATPAATAYGSAVLLSVSGLPGDATGTVSFTSGTTTLCRASLPAPSCETSRRLGADNYAVTATYSGDATYGGASAPTSFTITRVFDDTISAAATPGSAPYGTAVTLSATGLPADASGSVSFRWHSTVLCVSKVAGGAASCTVTKDLDVRRYDVVATYGGDGSVRPAKAATAFTVTPFALVVLAAASPTSIQAGHTVTLSVVGLPAGASGTVVFTAAGAALCTTILPSVSCSTSPRLASSHYAVTASYSGDDNYSSATARTDFTVVARLAAESLTLYTIVGNAVSTGLPLPKSAGPFELEIISQSPKADGTCTVTPSGHFRFVPANEFVGAATCTYVVRTLSGSRSAPAAVRIVVTSAGSPIPSAHTGEPWAGMPYWLLTGLLGLAGVALIGAGARRRKGLRQV
ncbi:MAG: Ig-like domain repeat protein [Acidimicrobiales bacterium]|jgi:hypothetical protein